jgi:hypothetical protein
MEDEIQKARPPVVTVDLSFWKVVVNWDEVCVECG